MPTSDEDTETDRASASTPPPSKKKKGKALKERRAQKYRSEWKTNTKAFGDDVSCWLDSDKTTQFKAKCKWCDTSVAANVTTIISHSKSGRHEKEREKRKSNSRLDLYVSAAAEPSLSQRKKIQSAEIKLSACLAAHNVPFQFIDHLVPTLQSAFPDCNILKGIQMKRLKTTRIVTNVIGAVHKEDLCETLLKVKFSVLTDESTHFNVKTAATAVRYFDKNEGEHGKIVVRFLDLSDVFPKGDYDAANEGASGKRLYELLVACFEKAGIPLDNLMGLGCDGASVNIGDHNSVISRLRVSCPGIILMRCVCHSLHLAARDACKCLPKSCEDMARGIHSFLQHSSKRVAQFAEFQDFLEVAQHKMLLLSLTRWLSMRDNVVRILEQWEALRLYVTQHRFEDNTHAAENLYKWLSCPIMKAYYLFLSWVLDKVTAMNAYFQGSNVLITSLHEKMREKYKEILQSFMKPVYLSRTALTDVNPSAQDQYVPLVNLYLGVEVHQQLQHEAFVKHPENAEIFRKCCRGYLVELCKGIRDRFDFNDPLLEALPVLKPKNATSIARRFNTSIIPFADLVPRAKPKDMATLQLLDDQWRNLPLDDIPRDIIEEKEVDVFWARIGKITDGEGNSKYAVLSEFVLSVLSIPHANADVERIFSKITLIRTRLRNRLITPTVEGLCLASECVKMRNKCCCSFEPSPKMLDSMTSHNLYGYGKDSSNDVPAGGMDRAVNNTDDPDDPDPIDMSWFEA
ncbi:Zinc finger protein 862 [Frankliniella fusca]|uniref:Zinc finger protein 862 n=1 Tax=Frankliniella fusca TaxID=407009 RepID=A0AAE1HD04_9NEOP|nr:Zinc finger protein 862 [Frankliniella fusca]